MLQVIDKQDENSDERSGLNIDEKLQDDLCKLWDMSMNAVCSISKCL